MSMFGGLKSVANEMFYKIKDFIDENFNKAATNFAGVEPPVSPSVGMFWEDTSTTPSMTKKYNSAGVWQKVLLISYIQSTAPANPLHYECWIDTSGNKSILKKWGGEEWEEIETIGQIEIDNIDGIEIAEYEELNEGDVLVYLADGKLHFQAPAAAPGANATHLNSAEIDDSAKTGESDGYVLKFNKTLVKYVLSENVASKLNDGASGKTYADIVNAFTGIMEPHISDASAHHSKYTDAEARSAMGAKANSNSFNHDRYTDIEARNAVSSHYSYSYKTYGVVVKAGGSIGIDCDYTSIATAVSNSPEGASIFVKNGIYNETENISPKNYQKLIGESRGKVRIYFSDATGIYIYQNNGVELENFSIIKNKVSNAVSCIFIELSECFNIFNIQIESGKIGIEIRNSNFGEIDIFRISNLYDTGILISNCSCNEIHFQRINNIQGYGIYISAAWRNTIYGGRIYDCPVSIKFFDSRIVAERNKIIGCEFDVVNASDGIKNLFVGNIIHTNIINNGYNLIDTNYANIKNF